MRLVTTALPDILAQAVSEKGLSMRDAARACGLSLGRFADVYYGRTQRPQPETLQSIADGLALPYPSLALAAYGVVMPVALLPVTA
jgi:hypothetical protein